MRGRMLIRWSDVDWCCVKLSALSRLRDARGNKRHRNEMSRVSPTLPGPAGGMVEKLPGVVGPHRVGQGRDAVEVEQSIAERDRAVGCDGLVGCQVERARVKRL